MTASGRPSWVVEKGFQEVRGMRIMLFCWAEEMKIELVNLAAHIARLPHNFVIAPLVRLRDKANYQEAISQLNRSSSNIRVDPTYLRSPDVKFRNLLNPNVLLSDFLSIVNLIRRSKPDVIVCFYVLHAYPLVLLKKFFRFSLCVVAMGSDVNLQNTFLDRLVKNVIYHNSDLIFANSWSLKNKIEKERHSNVIVVPSSADPSFFKPLNSRTQLRRKWRIQPWKRVVLTVCRLDKNKGVDILMRSIKLLNSDDVDLLIAGDGEERKSLEKLSASLGIQKNVAFLGFRERAELLELYNLADVFALASYSEGLPRVLIEAMACGCVPIVTNVGSAAKVVVDGFNGFTVRPGNYEEFAERINNIMLLPEEKLGIMRSRARRAVKHDFDSRRLIEKIVDNINALHFSRNGVRQNQESLSRPPTYG